jgi:hypothetical protein
MIWVGKRMINILKLSIDNKNKYNKNLTDNGLIGLSKHCNNLQSLNISGLPNSWVIWN